jgi:hypothetical protein
MGTRENDRDSAPTLGINGREHNQTTTKHDCARRWVRAINAWGELGR